MTKKFLSFVIAGTLAAAPALSFAEEMSQDSSSSSSSASSVATAGPCAGQKGRDFAACLRVRNLKARAQRTLSKSQDRLHERMDEKVKMETEKRQNALRSNLRREVQAVTKACGSKRGTERIQCIKDLRSK